MTKDCLTTLAGRPITLPENKVAEARRKYGQPFAHERGSDFRWQSGPTVLKEWLKSIGK